MNKTLKIIIAAVIALVVIVGLIFVFRNNASSVGMAMNANETPGVLASGNPSGNATSTLGPQEASVMTSLQDAPPPPKTDETSLANEDIDAYLKAYRSTDQPDPNDFSDSFSDLK